MITIVYRFFEATHQQNIKQIPGPDICKRKEGCLRMQIDLVCYLDNAFTLCIKFWGTGDEDLYVKVYDDHNANDGKRAKFDEKVYSKVWLG